MTESRSARSLRQAYLDWVEEQVEAYKESIPRSDLLRLADEVVEDLRVSQAGQYQLTEVLLCEAMDRKIIRLLKLPAYRVWVADRRARGIGAARPRTAPAPEHSISPLPQPRELPAERVIETQERVAV